MVVKLVRSTSLYIKQVMLEKGEANPYSIYKGLKAIKLKAGSYVNIRRYFNMLKHLHLIEFSRAEKSPTRVFDKHFYKIIQENVNSYAWKRPQIIMFPESMYGGAYYKKRLEEAQKEGITLRELALKRHPQIAKLRQELLTKPINNQVSRDVV